MADVIQKWEEYLKSETLTTDLLHADPPVEAYIETQHVDGETVILGLKQVA